MTSSAQRRQGEELHSEKDRKIIALLKKDSRMGHSEIGKEVGLSESAVRRRIKTLLDSGAIKRFTVEMGDEGMTKAVAFVTVESGTDVAKVSQRIMKLDGVVTVHEITGNYDIIASLSAQGILNVNESIDQLRKIQGVTNTNTTIILRTYE